MTIIVAFDYVIHLSQLRTLADNPSCIELFITNSPNSFQNTSTITTGLSDFHKMVIIVLNATLQKVSQRLLPIDILNCLMKKNLKLILKIL